MKTKYLVPLVLISLLVGLGVVINNSFDTIGETINKSHLRDSFEQRHNTKYKIVEDKSDSLLGVDGDKNGIRDDIDEYIAQVTKGRVPILKPVMEEYARHLTLVFRDDVTFEMKWFEEKKGRLSRCLNQIKYYDKSLSELKELELGFLTQIMLRLENTKKRNNRSSKFYNSCVICGSVDINIKAFETNPIQYCYVETNYKKLTDYLKTNK